jgi:hypothetical protein
VEQELVGLIPPPHAILCRVELMPYEPLAFHGYLKEIGLASSPPQTASRDYPNGPKFSTTLCSPGSNVVSIVGIVIRIFLTISGNF